MDDKYSPVLLITANVGSIFQDPEFLLKNWVKEFLATVKRLQPRFLALHCQEVGGKNYEESMIYVEDFVRTLMASEELMNFGLVRVFLDEDYTCTEKFTALGNLYFIHNSLKSVQLWDFHESYILTAAKTEEMRVFNLEAALIKDEHAFIPVVGKEVHSGNIEKVTTKEKAKFPREFFPECKWSRKGFMRTRWSINGTILDLINIHLFHDASNFISMDSFPSSYCKNRRHALEHTLKRFQNDEYEKVPFFMFGDFNFRLDTKAVIQRLTNKATPIYVKNMKNGEVVKILYRDPVNENRVILTLEKKVFDLENHEEIFFGSNGKWLQDFDKEADGFCDHINEYEINFPPSVLYLANISSYPFREDSNGATCYMRTRCPAWCDRILTSKSAKNLIYTNPEDSENSRALYQVMGSTVCMGDHKPVLLWFRLLPFSELSCQQAVCDSPSLPRVNLPSHPADTATVTRYIHVKYPGSPVRIVRETTV